MIYIRYAIIKYWKCFVSDKVVDSFGNIQMYGNGKMFHEKEFED